MKSDTSNCDMEYIQFQATVTEFKIKIKQHDSYIVFSPHTYWWSQKGSNQMADLVPKLDRFPMTFKHPFSVRDAA